MPFNMALSIGWPDCGKSKKYFPVVKSRIYKLLNEARLLDNPYRLDEIGVMVCHRPDYRLCPKTLDRLFICIGFNHNKYDANCQDGRATISFLTPGHLCNGQSYKHDEMFFSYSSRQTEALMRIFQNPERHQKFFFTPEIQKICDDIVEKLACLHQTGCADELDLLALQLVTSCLSQAKRGDGKYVPLDMKIHDIARELKNGCDLNSLLKKHAIGRRAFYLAWKRLFVLSPAQFRLAEMLSQAETHLTQSSATIGEIASLCGFSSLVYFCECFKRHTGMSPREYRRQHRDRLPL